MVDLNCEFYSDNNTHEFESRLDKIANIVRSDEVEITRKLLVGKANEEYYESLKSLIRETIKKFVHENKI